MPPSFDQSTVASGPSDAANERDRSFRGSSFNLIRRAKSIERPPTVRSPSTGARKLSSRRAREEAAVKVRQREEELRNAPAPQINMPLSGESSSPYAAYSSNLNVSRPSHYNPNAFYQRRMDSLPSSAANAHGGSPAAQSNASTPDVHAGDTHYRTESMTNRGRYNYANAGAASVNSPRRVRRRKDPTPFNVLVIGTKGCGKTSFIEFLRSSLAKPIKQRGSTPSPPSTTTRAADQNGPFSSHYLETEIDDERIGLTLYDSKALERHLVDLQLRELSSFLESKFQETFDEEQKVLRATGIRDTHIHCVLLLLDPSRLDANIAAATAKQNIHVQSDAYSSQPRIIGALDKDLDVEVIHALEGKTTVIPIISKADTITISHMGYLKRTIWDSLKKINCDPLAIIGTESDDESAYETADESALDRLNINAGRKSAYPEESQDSDDTSKNGNGATHSPSKQVMSGRGRSDNGGYPSKALTPPQHSEMRFSAMSEGVELPYLPLSILSPDMFDPGTIGRRFPWGFADPYNTEHCDFMKLKDSVFMEWRSELRQASRERWYEGWRTSRLRKRGQQTPTGNGYGASGRSVSGVPMYRTPTKDTTPMPAQRVLSTSNIGVAVGTDNSPFRST